MASATNISLNANLDKHIDTTNSGIQKILSSRTIPLWVNPNNSNFYAANPYNAGDVVILLSDLDRIYFLLRHYLENVGDTLGVGNSFFFEKNNPELTYEFIQKLIFGGYIDDDKYINPMTIVSNSEKGYGLYVSLKDKNYDMPGSSDSWFNLDMSESLESVQLQISRIISILTSSEYISKLQGLCTDMKTGKPYQAMPAGDSNTYLNNRLEMHKQYYHFGENSVDPERNDSSDAYDLLNAIQTEIESQTNTTTSIMRNPFILNDKIIGNMMTIIQTTGQMLFYCILDTTSLEQDKDITIQFTPSSESNIIVPIIPRTNSGIITVSNPNTDDYVLTSDGKHAWYVDSFVHISNSANASNDITIETNSGFEEANFNNNFTGFIDDAYIATYTPIGVESRMDNVAIHCSPVKEISRTNKSLTFQLRSDYVWRYTGLAIALNGKCDLT